MADEGNSQPDVSKVRQALEACEARVEELEEENSQLRQSSRAFGDLAERLNTRRTVATAGRGVDTSTKR
jgi:hypothetical protein